jgi:hypothetical protein
MIRRATRHRDCTTQRMLARRPWPVHLSFIAMSCGAGLLAIVGCVHPSSIAEQRAHYDLDCPHGPVTMTTLAGDTYIARGCGRTAVYTCIDSGDGRSFDRRWSCIKESAKRETDAH